MNRGLKSYTKQLTQEIGSAKACVNINENDANMHIVLPLVKTLGNFPIDLNLIYTHQNRNVTDKHFGKGFKLDCCPLVSFVGDDIIIQNADGSKDLYKNGVFNTETGLKVENRGGEIRIIDKTGNVTTYKLDGGTTVSNCISMDFSAKTVGRFLLFSALIFPIIRVIKYSLLKTARVILRRQYILLTEQLLPP